MGFTEKAHKMPLIKCTLAEHAHVLWQEHLLCISLKFIKSPKSGPAKTGPAGLVPMPVWSDATLMIAETPLYA